MTTPGAAGERVFVGRDALLTEMVRELDEGVHLRADDLSGPVGMGKSALLAGRSPPQMLRGAMPRSRFTSSTLTTTTRGVQATPVTRSPSVPSRRTSTRSSVWAQRFSSALQPELLPRFDAAVDEAFKAVIITPGGLNITNQMVVGDFARVEGAAVTTKLDSLAQQVTTAFQKAGLQVAEEFVDCLNVVASERPLLLLVDDIDRIANQEIGTWLRGVLENLQRAVIVMTHEPGESLELPPGLGSTLKLAPLSEDEVGEYLRQRPVPDGSSELARLVHAYSGGRPVVVGLVHDLLLDPDSGLTIEDLSDGLLRLPADPEDRLAVVVKNMVERFEGELLMKALQAASVPRYLDAELLARLLEDGFGEHELDLPKIMRDLESFSFIDEFTAGAERVHYVRVHPFIRRGLVEQMRTRERSRVYTALHECAARY